MPTDSAGQPHVLAALRKSASSDFADLAQRHLQHDLIESDRDTLEAAARNLSFYATFGSLLGVGLGFFLAFRVRLARARAYRTIRAAEKPTHVQFRDGTTEPLPDMSPLLKSSALGDVAAYTFFGAGGLFLGGETGAIIGSYSAHRTISCDPESQRRIERAFRSFRADLLRRQAEKLEKGEGSVEF